MKRVRGQVFLLLIVLSAALVIGCELILTGDHVYIYSVIASPTSSEEVRLKNPADTSVDLAGWTLGNLGNPTAYTFPSGSIIHSDSYRTCIGAFLGFEIKDSGDLIFLKNASGSTVDTWNTY